jgi:hypothetical protein
MAEGKVTEALLFATAPRSLTEPAGSDSDINLTDLVEGRHHTFTARRGNARIPTQRGCLADGRT